MPLALLENPIHHRNTQDGSTKTTGKQARSWAQFQGYFYSTFQCPSATATVGIVGTTTKSSIRKPLGNSISPTNHGKKCLVTLQCSAMGKVKGNTAVNQSMRTTSLKTTAQHTSIFHSPLLELLFDALSGKCKADGVQLL